MILIIGANGMLGSEVKKLLPNAKAVDKDELDITSSQSYQKILDLKPELIINCAAYTDVDGAETNKELCKKINVDGTLNIARAAKTLNIPLIHISTDYVFNGEKKTGYNKDDKKDPINYYGQTKADSEEIIIQHLEKYYLIRTAWLFGKNGKNFVKTIIRLCNEKDQIKVINDQIGSPTYTLDLAKQIVNFTKADNNSPYGIYHFTNSETCSWYEFAEEIKKQKNLTCNIQPCSTQDYPLPAKRPEYSILLSTLDRRPWKEALKDYLEEV